ncbi:MAG: hypothetical protein H6642_00065 [Caldilineaceae bacterium]|nr:hypothetical protein [Caldilineaceae bacterium]
MIRLRQTGDGKPIELEIDDAGWDQLVCEGFDIGPLLDQFGIATAPDTLEAQAPPFLRDMAAKLRDAIFNHEEEALVFVNDDDDNRVVCIHCGNLLAHERAKFHFSWDAHDLLLDNGKSLACCNCDTAQRVRLDNEQAAVLCERVVLANDGDDGESDDEDSDE